MPRLYQITMRWNTLPKGEDSVKPFEERLALAGNWLRFSGWAWYISSDYNPTQIRDIVKSATIPDDHFLILEVNMQGADGNALPWIWDWLRKKGL